MRVVDRKNDPDVRKKAAEKNRKEQARKDAEARAAEPAAPPTPEQMITRSALACAFFRKEWEEEEKSSKE
jgi:hypothetical protein